MTSEEAKKQFNNIDFKSMNDKVVISMMEIVQLPSPDEAYILFHNISERFTHDELAFLTANHIAEKFKNMLMEVNTKMGGKPMTSSGFEEFFNNLRK